jgi:8-oxo-dGTP pyrophosphatase MutT (NUDIX family)
LTLADRLRRALDGPAPAGLLAGDLSEGVEGPLTPAAVLVAITRRPEPGVLLTVRREHMRTHAGQIAFPGGRIDAEDKGPAAAALREAEEEIGLARDTVTLWGPADRYRTITGYEVHPILGEVAPDLPLFPHPEEVADWFEAPLAFLLDPANQRQMEADFRGARRTYYEIPWEGRRIWGATAAMIVNLSRRLAAAA